MRNKRRVLLLNVFAHKGQLLLHLLKLESSDLVPKLDVLLDAVVVAEGDVTPEKLQLLEGEHLVEEEIA